MKMMLTLPRHSYAAILWLSLIMVVTEAQAPSHALAKINRITEDLIQEQGLPGLAVAAVANTDQGFKTWTTGYGFSNVESKVLATADTNYWMASVTKTITGTLIMKAQEQGKLRLNSKASDILETYDGSFVLGNEGRLENVTVEHLATHTSLIRDSAFYGCSYYLGDPTSDEYQLLLTYAGMPNDCSTNVSLETGGWLKEYLSPDGAYYNDTENFVSDDDIAPGGIEEYSNVGTALAGYLVELATETSLPEYSTKELFDPLGMIHSSFLLSDLDASNVAIPYFPLNDQVMPLPFYNLATRPDGGLRSTANDMAKFLGMVMNDGTLNGATVLQEASVKDMLLSRFNGNVGIYWTTGNQQFDDGSLRSLVGHTGGDPGAVSFLFFDPARETGAFIVSNGDSDLPDVDEETVYKLLIALFDRADELKEEFGNSTDAQSSSSSFSHLLSVAIYMLCSAFFSY